jgi:hypothetical protein
MRIAFYAPLKHPDHPTPSGDRRVARLLVEALRRSGHEVAIASRLRSFVAQGDAARQARIARIGTRMADRLLRRYRKHGNAPRLWLTYHLYYKAPDHLGPRVARELSIPYVAVEASIADKRANGPWDIGHRACVAALRQADAIVTLNKHDDAALDAYLGADCRRVALAPFLDCRATRRRSRACWPWACCAPATSNAPTKPSPTRWRNWTSATGAWRSREMGRPAPRSKNDSRPSAIA